MISSWMRVEKFTLPSFVTSALVVVRKPKGDSHPPKAINAEVISLLTARAGSVSLCFKYHKAQTFGHLAPGCEDELSGLDPANTSRLQLHEGHTDEKCYQEEGGLCLLTVKHGIKTPTGSDTFPESQSTNYVKEPRRTGSHARSSRRRVEGIVISMGGNDEYEN